MLLKIRPHISQGWMYLWSKMKRVTDRVIVWVLVTSQEGVYNSAPVLCPISLCPGPRLSTWPSYVPVPHTSALQGLGAVLCGWPGGHGMWLLEQSAGYRWCSHNPSLCGSPWCASGSLCPWRTSPTNTKTSGSNMKSVSVSVWLPQWWRFVCVTECVSGCGICVNMCVCQIKVYSSHTQFTAGINDAAKYLLASSLNSAVEISI